MLGLFLVVVFHQWSTDHACGLPERRSKASKIQSRDQGRRGNEMNPPEPTIHNVQFPNIRFNMTIQSVNDLSSISFAASSNASATKAAAKEKKDEAVEHHQRNRALVYERKAQQYLKQQRKWFRRTILQSSHKSKAVLLITATLSDRVAEDHEQIHCVV